MNGGLAAYIPLTESVTKHYINYAALSFAAEALA